MNKKVSYIIIILITIITILLLVLLSNNDKKDNIDVVTEKYLIIDNYSTWMYTNKWEKIDNSKISGKKLKAFINDELQGLTTFSFGSKWNLYNDNDEYIDYEGDLIAASPELKLSVDKIIIEDIGEKELNEINSILNKNYEIDFFTTKELVKVDLDKNGNLDYIVNVNNLNDEEANEYVSLIYAKVNNNVMILNDKSIDLKDYLNTPRYRIKEVIDLNNNKYVIIQKGFFSLAGKNGNIMFEYIDNKFKLVMED